MYNISYSIFGTARDYLRAFLSVMALIALTGCAMQKNWVKPGKSPSDFQADKSECSLIAMQLAPPNFQSIQTSQGYTQPIYTNCSANGNNIDCMTTGGKSIPPTYLQIDSNLGFRRSQETQCLYDKGWQLLNQDEIQDLKNRLSPKPKEEYKSEKTPAKNIDLRIGVGAYCSNYKNCTSGLTCIENKCLINLGK